MRAKTLFVCFALWMVLVVAGTAALANAGADLVVTSVSGPREVFLNQTIAMTYRVKNNGDAASGAYDVGLYVSTNKTINPATDRFLKKVSFAKGLTAGQTRKATTKVIVPSSYLNEMTGYYYYGASVESSRMASSKRVAIARYKDNGDGTVTDFKTGLMWQKTDDNPATTWADAKYICAELQLAGYNSWLLPPVDALATIQDTTRSFPSIDPIFNCLNCRSLPHWSSTTHAADPTVAWSVGFSGGSVQAAWKGVPNLPYRCVREGP